MRDEFGFDYLDDDWLADAGGFDDDVMGEDDDDVDRNADDLLGFLAGDFAAGTGCLTDWFGL